MKRKGTTARPRRGVGPLLFLRIRELFNHSQLQRLFIKALPGDGSPLPPSVLLPHPSFLHRLAQPLKTGRDACERVKRGQRGTKRKRSAMQSAEKCLPTANKQRFFRQSAFFCGSFGSIGDVVSLLFMAD